MLVGYHDKNSQFSSFQTLPARRRQLAAKMHRGAPPPIVHLAPAVKNFMGRTAPAGYIAGLGRG